VLQSFVDAKPTLSMERSSVLQVGELALTTHAWKATGTGPDGPVELAGDAVEVVRRQADGTWRFVIDDPYGRNTIPMT
jgi:ketosteroid isomerase-like protein